MSNTLLTVEQAAEQLALHPKTVLRYIHDGRLPATRIGKSYRIEPTRLRELTGVASPAGVSAVGRATCVVDIADVTPDEAQQLASFVNAAGTAGGLSNLHLETIFDPIARSMKIVTIGSPAHVATVLQMIELKLGGR